MLSRNIIFELGELGHQVYLQPAERIWEPIETGARERLEGIPLMEDYDRIDVVLQIGTPGACRKAPKPSLIYTQNALGDLPDPWIETLGTADGCIVPSEFDRRVFSRYFERVYVARQSSDPRIFRPEPSRRAEGSERFTFLFVGSYGYRKGVDLLLEAFLHEFSAEENVELVLQAAGISTGARRDHLPGYVERINPNAHVRVSGESLLPDAMARLYNRSDCLVTMSRGEGWCMPVTEALLCGVPVIAPRSTGMAEYLSDEIAHLVPVAERSIAEIDDPFGAGIVRQYGKPGNVCFEPSIDQARRQMRSVFEEPEAAREKAALGRTKIADELSWPSAAREVERALLDLLGEEVCFDTAIASSAEKKDRGPDELREHAQKLKQRAEKSQERADKLGARAQKLERRARKQAKA